MSSVSSFKPEDDSESEFELRGLPFERQTRSVSRAASVAVTSPPSDTPSVEDIDLEADDTETRYADLEARIQALDRRALEDYSKFLEDEKGYFTFSKVDENAEIFNVTQYGAVVWTATEKEKFFNHLDRKGRDGIREIAAAIGTKSELEVMDYLSLLHENLISHHIQALQNFTVILSEIPAAAEIGDPCRAELDKYAEVLTLKEDLDHSTIIRKRYGNNWVITDRQARKLADHDCSEPLRGSIHLAAAILNVPDWVNLSRKLYMKFGGRREEDDWTNIRQAVTDTPSISGEALMDFYALTLTITRRLIQSSIFLAMSRTRQLQQLGCEDPNPDVRKEDVRSAIDVLNMKHTRGSFAFDAARRNGLTIVDDRHQKGWKSQMLSYDEVEKILNGDEDDLHSESVHSQSDQDGQGDSEDEDFVEDEAVEGHSSRNESAQAEPDSPAALEPEARADDSDDEDEDGEENQDHRETHQHDEPQEPESPPENLPPEEDIKQDEPDPQEPDFYSPTRRPSLQSVLSSGEEEQASDAEEKHADRHDQETSRVAEMKLWSLLRQPGPPGVSTPLFTMQQIKEDVLNRPLVMRKTRRELTGWRDLTLYHSEWEEYGTGAQDLVDELAENRRKRRRIEEEDVSRETGDEEEDEEDEEDESQGNERSENGDDGSPIYKSASVVNSEESDVDEMDIDDEVRHGTSVPSKSPSIAIELPKYEPDVE